MASNISPYSWRKKMPFLFLFVLILTSLILGYCTGPEEHWPLGVTILITILSFIGFLSGPVVRSSALNTVHSLLLILLLCSLALEISRENFHKEIPPVLIQHLRQRIDLLVRVQSAKERSLDYAIECDLIAINGKLVDKSQSYTEMVLFIKKGEGVNLIRGDRLWVNCRLDSIPESRMPSGPDWRTYYGRKGIFLQGKAERYDFKVCERKTGSIGTYLNQLPMKFSNYFLKVQEESTSRAIVLGMIMGQTSQMDQELKNNFSKTGVFHVLSVSGLHVGIVYMILKFLFSIIFRSRTFPVYCTVCIIICIWLYAFITGLSPSVTRSAFMFTILLMGDSIGRKANVFNSLFCSAFFLVCNEPGLIFDIGFQLSYSAVLGIVLFNPIFNRLWNPSGRIMGWLWSLLTVSVAAQLATLPACLLYFQQFPTYFLISNVIAVPATGIIITLSIVTALTMLTDYLKILSNLLSATLEIFINSLLDILGFISNLPFSSISFLINERGLVFMYIMVAISTYWLYSGWKKVFLFVIILSCIWVVDNCVETIRSNQKNQAYLVSVRGNIFAGLVGGGRHEVLPLLLDTIDQRTENDLGKFWISAGIGEAEIRNELPEEVDSEGLLLLSLSGKNYLFVQAKGRENEVLPISCRDLDGIIFSCSLDYLLTKEILSTTRAVIYSAGLKWKDENTLRSLCRKMKKEYKALKYNDYYFLEN